MTDPQTVSGRALLAQMHSVVVQLRELAFPDEVGQPVPQDELRAAIVAIEREAAERATRAGIPDTDVERLYRDIGDGLHECMVCSYRWTDLSVPNHSSGCLVPEIEDEMTRLRVIESAARSVCGSPLHSREFEPTAVFDALRAALDATGEPEPNPDPMNLHGERE